MPHSNRRASALFKPRGLRGMIPVAAGLVIALCIIWLILPKRGEIAWPQGFTTAHSGSDFSRFIQPSGARLVVVNFWATWCAPCIKELPSLEELRQAYAGRGLDVQAVLVDPLSRAEALAFLRKLGVRDLPLSLDSESQWVRALRQKEARAPTGLPVSVLVDAQGREVARLLGGREWDEPAIRKAIDAFLQRS